MKPRVFIASSVERLDLAYAAQENLEHAAEVTVWSQGVFQLSRTAMASLLDQLDATDFGVFVLAPDDLVRMRDKEISTARDNVIFELGLFVGRLGSERCFLVVPRGSEDLHLPSDLTGVTPALFEADRQDANLTAALGPACNRIRKSMSQQGRMEEPPAPSAEVEIPTNARPPVGQDDLCDDENDCLSILQSWMGARTHSANQRAMRFDDVDSELRLAPGSAKKYLARAAQHFNYITEREGKDTIMFKKVQTSHPFY